MNTKKESYLKAANEIACFMDEKQKVTLYFSLTLIEDALKVSFETAIKVTKSINDFNIVDVCLYHTEDGSVHMNVFSLVNKASRMDMRLNY